MDGDALLERMREAPCDWCIADVERRCRAFGIACTPPRKGSHYKVRHEAVAPILTIPAHRPIQPVYVRESVRFVELVRERRK